MADPDDTASEPKGAGTIRDAVFALAGRFRAAGLATPELDARLIVLETCGLSHEAYIIDAKRVISTSEAALIEARALRRLDREPVSRILGKREFYGRDFAIAPAVLDPRPDTETLVSAALAQFAAEGAKAKPLRILDLGTGSGCILLSLLAEWPEAWGVGIDISPDAIAVARQNAGAFALMGRSAFACMDWTAAIDGEFDVILSNPPYIASADIDALAPEVRQYDPRLALDGSSDGLSAYRRLAADCMRLLRPGGWIFVEAGAEQAKDILGLFEMAGWLQEEAEWRFYPDLAGINRVVAIKRQRGR